MNISICVTSYNGEKYIKEQIKSILSQLSANDEVIVCDDCSLDRTVEIINEIKDPRIKLFSNKKNLGYVKNFEKAISIAQGDYIFLSDQDDIWPEDRIVILIEALKNTKKLVAVGNLENFHELQNHNKPITLSSKLNKDLDLTPRMNVLRIFLGKLSYFGCCIAFKKEAKHELIPFPSSKISHDIWIALKSNLRKTITHTEKTVTLRRIHENNVTNTNRPLHKKIWTRIQWATVILKVFIKNKLLKRT